jgi:hypothetical protein
MIRKNESGGHGREIDFRNLDRTADLRILQCEVLAFPRVVFLRDALPDLAFTLDLAPTFTFKPWEPDPDPFEPFLLEAERVPFVKM